MILDRAIQPAVYPIANLSFVTPETRTFGQTTLVEFKGGDKEVIRLRVVYEAGTKHHENPVVPAAVNSLLKEGTKKRSAAQIADELDFYGAFLHTEINKDHAWVELYCLTKHFSKIIPVFTDILSNPVFHEDEIKVYRNNAIQKLNENFERVSFLAKNKLQGLLFGQAHYYGAEVTEDHYHKIDSNTLSNFFKSHMFGKIARVEIVGQFQDNELTTIIRELDLEKGHQAVTHQRKVIQTPSSHRIFIPKKEAVQSAIAIGKLMPNRTHPDFFGAKVLICVLGGYFGSRLMTNIREEKGFTYGIGAGLGSYQEQGILSIGTEVGVQVKDEALLEIYKEIKRLVDEEVPVNELTLVKNYMKGSLLKQCDGIFAQADLLHSLFPFNLDFSYYQEFIKTINHISAKQLQQLAEKYLSPTGFVEVVAGGSDN